VSATLGTKEYYPSLNQVLDLYKTQNPAFVPDPKNPVEDNGMDIQTCLEYLAKTGGPDGVKAIAFAKVDPRNLDEMKAAIAIFGGLWLGVDVLEANMSEFDSGKPWDYVAGSPLAGGHSILGGGYTDNAKDDIKFITWGAETSFTDAFVAHEFGEAWVVIWPEHLGSRAFLEGVDMVTLAADYTALTGKPFPVAPTPQPAPAPVPAPTPTTDADTTLANAVRVWAFARHSGANRIAALAVQAWLKAKNL
jgi:hypothetical protein